MEFKKCTVSLFVILILFSFVNGHLPFHPPNIEALDQSLYENVLDPELCQEQIRHIMQNSVMALRFADAGIRTPRGVLQGNTVDLGNYHQCLDIVQPLENSLLQGKYCMIRMPLSQNIELPNLPEWLELYDSNTLELKHFNPREMWLNNDTIKELQRFETMFRGARAMVGTVDNSRLVPESPLAGMTFRLAVCIPKTCSTQQAMTSALFNLSKIGFEYQDDFCRLPNDKLWAPADYIILVLFSVLGLLTLLSTSYDLYHTFIYTQNYGKSYSLARTFSLYTNGRRLMSFSSSPDNLECLDGVRALAMVWVVLGHSFTSVPFWANPIETFQWVSLFSSLWITGAHVTVDTFFTLSGILVVYTTAGKFNGRQLLKNLHLFYLNRLLRMFPILATVILFEASYINHMTDGPFWNTIANYVSICRVNWWSTLLHVQNYMNPEHTCIGQSWYLAIDVQLHILSPLILYWVLSGNKTTAWIALTSGLLTILIVSTVYNFIMEFPSGMMSPNRGHEMMYYLVYYYVNTMTRAAPFIVGMICGYILHLYRVRKADITKGLVTFIWISTFTLLSFVMYSSYPILQMEWDNQTLDSLYNSFIRPIWATGLGLMIFACIQGYGGPINWLLSLRIWKLPARISYAIYLFHWSLMVSVNSTAIAPVYFSTSSVVYRFLSHFAFTFAVAFFVTLVVDAPFSTIFKLLLSKAPKKAKPRTANIDEDNEISKEIGKRMN